MLWKREKRRIKQSHAIYGAEYKNRKDTWNTQETFEARKEFFKGPISKLIIIEKISIPSCGIDLGTSSIVSLRLSGV